MKLTVNGAPYELPGAADGAALLTRLQVNPQTVVVELNGVIVRREEFLGQGLAEGDVLELVTLVGGG